MTRQRFYSTELLSYRQKGHLAPCWLAALLSEKEFKKLYSSNAIKKINIVELCDEIQQQTFSVYLSSQLMYGITKIHSYQTAYYEKEAFKFEQKFEANIKKKQKKDKSDLSDGGFLDIPDIQLPPPRQNFLNVQLGADLHLLPSEDVDRLQVAMQDAASLNFGCLNDEEMELMLQPGSLFDLGIRHVSEGIDIADRMADITITEEVHRERYSSQEISSPVIVDISKIHDKSRKTLTPKKRQPPPGSQIQTETPKKKRLSLEPVVEPAPLEDAAVAELPVNISAGPVEDQATAALPQPEVEPMDIESLHSSNLVNERRFFLTRKPIVIDQTTTLSNNLLLKWRRDVNAHIKKNRLLDIPSIHQRRIIPSINLVRQPSHEPKRWSAELRNMFDDFRANPRSLDEDVPHEDVLDEDVPEDVQHEHVSAIRVEETISGINMPKDDLSSIAKTITETAAEPTIDSTVNIQLPAANVIYETEEVPPLPEAISDPTTSERGTRVVDHKRDQRESISNIDESFEDIEFILEKRRRVSSTHEFLQPLTSPTSRFSLTSHTIWQKLQIFWSKQPCVKFSTLYPIDRHTREDAGVAFSILLEFHAQMKLILQQHVSYRTLRIWIYDLEKRITITDDAMECN